MYSTLQVQGTVHENVPDVLFYLDLFWLPFRFATLLKTDTPGGSHLGNADVQQATKVRGSDAI